jgi:hypothetical protein
VPHVGLIVEKLDAYLNTWGVGGNDFAVGFDKIYEQYKIVTSIEVGELEISRNKQFTEIKKAFDLIVQTLSS